MMMTKWLPSARIVSARLRSPVLGLLLVMLAGCSSLQEFTRGIALAGLGLGAPLGRPSSGSNSPDQRGDIHVGFINRTPYRAIFTVGTFDPLNPQQNPTSPAVFPIKFIQFGGGDGAARRLDAFTESDIITLSKDLSAFPANIDPGGCGRAVSVGGSQLTLLIEGNISFFPNLDRGALRPLCDTFWNRPGPGIAFVRETDGIGENACESEVVESVEGMTTYLGVEYQCGALLLYTFDYDPALPEGRRVSVGLTVVEP